jgi:hypothetical protein
MNKQRNAGTLIAGSVLIAIGILSIIAQVFRQINFWETFWPLIIIGIGAVFFAGMLAGGRSASGLAIPGSIFSATGLMLFYQNLTNHWESWAYGWTVILMSVGIGIFLMGAWGGKPEQRQAGLRVLRVGIIMFVIFGAFFELIFTGGMPFGLRTIFFPAALIVLGLYLILSRTGLFKKRVADEDKATQPENMEE